MSEMKIDIVSDVACPWCPIGYKRLEVAMQELAAEGLAFEVEWRPFELAPDMPAEGEEIVPHLVRKYGRSASELMASQEQIIAAARELGLNFDGALRRRAVNTFDAHRVLVWAGEQGRQTEFALALFDAYFGRAENPADPAVLRRIAANLGLDAGAIDEIVTGDRYAEAVRRQEQTIHRAGIHAVPTFMIGGEPLIQGAQPPAVFASVLRQVAAQVS
ncbi:MAG TPA: DsbA family oxidoreductase [Gammaproteobacteria bacterium]|nr:DsbA family oxidoreductase [Gammaproteobacteria bacterium]